MEHFLLYIIVSSLVTLVSIMFAYKPTEDELRLVDFNSMEGNKIESAPVYTDQPMKSNAQAVASNKLEATLS